MEFKKRHEQILVDAQSHYQQQRQQQQQQRQQVKDKGFTLVSFWMNHSSLL